MQYGAFELTEMKLVVPQWQLHTLLSENPYARSCDGRLLSSLRPGHFETSSSDDHERPRTWTWL